MTPTDLRHLLIHDLGVNFFVFEDDTPLFSSGRLDSLTLTALVVALEQRLGLRLGVLDISLKNLDSVNAMAALVQRKTAGRG